MARSLFGSGFPQVMFVTGIFAIASNIASTTQSAGDFASIELAQRNGCRKAEPFVDRAGLVETVAQTLREPR